MAIDDCHLAGICQEPSGACTTLGKPDDANCDDGNGCTDGDACRAGVCQGVNVTCTPIDTCHTPGLCNPVDGVCIDGNAKPDHAACDDGSKCTSQDQCTDGACAGRPIECDEGDACHFASTCNAATGACTEAIARAEGTECDDGNPCTERDACAGSGMCLGTPKVCQSAGVCYRVGTCDLATGQCSTPYADMATVCDDRDVCTPSDYCSRGACVGMGTPNDASDDWLQKFEPIPQHVAGDEYEESIALRGMDAGPDGSTFVLFDANDRLKFPTMIEVSPSQGSRGFLGIARFDKHGDGAAFIRIATFDDPSPARPQGQGLRRMQDGGFLVALAHSGKVSFRMLDGHVATSNGGASMVFATDPFGSVRWFATLPGEEVNLAASGAVGSVYDVYDGAHLIDAMGSVHVPEFGGNPVPVGSQVSVWFDASGNLAGYVAASSGSRILGHAVPFAGGALFAGTLDGDAGTLTFAAGTREFARQADAGVVGLVNSDGALGWVRTIAGARIDRLLAGPGATSLLVVTPLSGAAVDVVSDTGTSRWLSGALARSHVGLISLDATGDAQWALELPGLSTMSPDGWAPVSVNDSNIAVVGQCAGMVDLEATSSAPFNCGTGSVFTAKIGANGAVAWAYPALARTSSGPDSVLIAASDAVTIATYPEPFSTGTIGPWGDLSYGPLQRLTVIIAHFNSAHGVDCGIASPAP